MSLLIGILIPESMGRRTFVWLLYYYGIELAFIFSMNDPTSFMDYLVTILSFPSRTICCTTVATSRECLRAIVTRPPKRPEAHQSSHHDTL